MLIAIDGTGAYYEQEYQYTMRGSFCNQLYRGLLHRPSLYIEGPGNAGGTLEGKIAEATNLIKAFYFETVPAFAGHRGSALVPRKDRCTLPLFISGYSRGGATALGLAWNLGPSASTPVHSNPFISPEPKGMDKHDKIGIVNRHILRRSDYDHHPDIYYSLDVEAMFLFDPVSRDVFLPERGIPSNVGNAYVMYRDRSVEVVNPPLREDPFGDIYARKWMGNADITPKGKTRPVTQIIANASHGAVGGVPWNEGKYARPADEQATINAAAWMNNHLRAHKLPVTLRNMYKFETIRSPMEKLYGTWKSSAHWCGSTGTLHIPIYPTGTVYLPKTCNTNTSLQSRGTFTMDNGKGQGPATVDCGGTNALNALIRVSIESGPMIGRDFTLAATFASDHTMTGHIDTIHYKDTDSPDGSGQIPTTLTKTAGLSQADLSRIVVTDGFF